MSEMENEESAEKERIEGKKEEIRQPKRNRRGLLGFGKGYL